MRVKMTPLGNGPPVIDELGRESFLFLTECPHDSTIPALICSDIRTIREVADTTIRLAIDACIHCFADHAIPLTDPPHGD